MEQIMRKPGYVEWMRGLQAKLHEERQLEREEREWQAKFGPPP